jgi:hypothetical protein
MACRNKINLKLKEGKNSNKILLLFAKRLHFIFCQYCFNIANLKRFLLFFFFKKFLIFIFRLMSS